MIFKADNWDGNIHHPANKFLEMYSLETLVAGNWVSIVVGDTASPGGGTYHTVQSSDSDDVDGEMGICGICVTARTDAGLTRIQVAGFYSGANVAATVAAGELLVASTTAGQAQDSNLVADAVQLNFRIAGQAVTAAVANAADVIIFPHPAFSAA